MINLFFKILIGVSFVLIFSCSSGKKLEKISNDIKINLIPETQNRYYTILKYELNKINYESSDNLKIYDVEVKLIFSSEKTLTLNGLKPLYIMTGNLEYKLKTLENKLIETKNVFAKINYGNVNSIFAKEKNEILVKERITKLLSKKMFHKIKLSLNKIEN